uniref:hypothetical protein n=1 Tax=Acetomicrobium sp. S15 = DSM 107314 TaxID=2529858 RepID=UPI0018E0CF38
GIIKLLEDAWAQSSPQGIPIAMAHLAIEGSAPADFEVTLLLGMMFDSVVQYGGSFGWGALVAVPAVAFLAYPFGILPAFLTGMAHIGLRRQI